MIEMGRRICKKQRSICKMQRNDLDVFGQL